MKKATKEEYTKEVIIANIGDQLMYFCQNASTDINKQMYDQAKKLGFKDEDLKSNPKVKVKFRIKPGKTPGFNFFTWYIEDSRIFKKNERILGSVEFGPSGYIVYMQEPKIKGAKPSLIDLSGNKLKKV